MTVERVRAAAHTISTDSVEYFNDHVRIEQMLFDGALAPTAGRLRPDRSRPGLGITLKAAAAPSCVYRSA